MELDEILSPVRGEMSLVTETIGQAADVEYPRFAEIVRQAIGNLGKGIRPALTLLSGKFNNYNLKDLVPMSAAVELLHTASLVHDDTIDKSPLRRGLPTVANIVGDNAAILAGDYLFAKSAELAAEPGNLRVVRLFARTLMDMAKGELEEALSLYDWHQDREAYFRRIGGKTAVLFSMAAESGAILSDSPEEDIQALQSYGYNLGLAFQIIDDLLDFTGEERTMGKPVGNDLLQGVLTLPAIIYLERHAGSKLIEKGFESRGDGPYLNQAIVEIRDSLFIKDCYAVAEEFSSKACQDIENMPDGDPKKVLVGLAEHVIGRQK